MLGKLRKRQKAPEAVSRSSESEMLVPADLTELGLLLDEMDKKKKGSGDFYYFHVKREEKELLGRSLSVDYGNDENARQLYRRLKNVYLRCLVAEDTNGHARNGSN